MKSGSKRSLISMLSNFEQIVKNILFGLSKKIQYNSKLYLRGLNGIF